VENQVAEDLAALPGGVEGNAAQIVMNRIRMGEAKSAATTAGRITMQTEAFSEEAKGAGKQVVDTSKLFPRTNIPAINQALAAYETQTGDPNIIKFGTSINALLNAYGKLSNPTGTGIHDADKTRLEKILSTKLAQGQIEAGVDQIITEGQVVSKAIVDAQKTVLAQLTPSGVTGSPPAQQAPAGGVIKYDAQGNRVQ
jgi:hypothetical protein